MQTVVYPDPRLRRRAELVQGIDGALRAEVLEMFQLMYRENGIGLAAPQVGWGARIFIMNPLGAESPEGERVFINPEILEQSGADQEEEEGCLSIPDVRGRVVRKDRVWVRARDLDGESFEAEFRGLPARVVLHENDHLDGILFISRLSQTEKLLVRRPLRDLEREYRRRLKEEEATPRR
ncbi:MAG: peptide deformylase [Planctomycetes bacterium]|nr:peptide deformylase [Planctomycetota bacterium]